MKRKIQRWQVDDFRAQRRLLDPEVFLNGSNPPPSDLVSKEIWNSIMHLPDHVSITTSNHHGSQLRFMHDLAVRWVGAIGSLEDRLYYPMVDAGYEFDISVFNSLHGWYRPSIGALRNALELVTIGAYAQISGGISEYAEWRAGNTEISFGYACDKFTVDKTIKEIETYLKRTIKDSLFSQKSPSSSGGWARRLHRELSHYSHSQPMFTDVDMWRSNGPIYVADVFQHTVELYRQTFALCYLIIKLARVDFALPEDTLMLFEQTKEDWTQIANCAFERLFG